jgi:hypothetical protein
MLNILFKLPKGAWDLAYLVISAVISYVQARKARKTDGK